MNLMALKRKRIIEQKYSYMMKELIEQFIDVSGHDDIYRRCSFHEVDSAFLMKAFRAKRILFCFEGNQILTFKKNKLNTLDDYDIDLYNKDAGQTFTYMGTVTINEKN